eukprot:Transcript_13668.p1 GENE.Transcript_13668~~Transcript_13668.p1  ORF type:complete len:219 (+),score=35.24 Transcript_13668:108-764(+)
MPAFALALLTSARARAGPAAFKPEQLPGCGADQIREANQAASALHSCAGRTAHAAQLATAENAMEARDWTLATMQLLLMARDSTAESEATMCTCASKFAAGGPACGGIGELKRNMTQSMPSCGSQEELELEENADYSYEQYDTNSYGDSGDEESVDEGSLRLVGLAVFVAGAAVCVKLRVGSARTVISAADDVEEGDVEEPDDDGLDCEEIETRRGSC